MNKKKLFEFCYGCLPEDLPERAIVTPFIPAKKFLEHSEVISSYNGRLYSGVIAEKNGKKFTVINCGMGSLLAGDAVLLLELSGVKEIVFTGSCGGMNGCKTGDLVIPGKALSGEGFTIYHGDFYDLEKILEPAEVVPANEEFTKELSEFVSKNLEGGLDLRLGKIFTIGSLLAETEETVLKISEKGFTGIDMELAVVYHAARKVEIRASGIVFVSDLPLERPLWEKIEGEESERYAKGFSETVRLVVEFIAK